MLVIINVISLCAHLYSVEYMSADAHMSRFISYLSLFTFFMLVLVLSDNVLQLFVGWEGVGICSYLLINFWFSRIQANKSAILAVMVNKVGDIALLIGCAALQYMYHSVNFATVTASTVGVMTYGGIHNSASELVLHVVGNTVMLSDVTQTDV
jgi:NADH:ubiquinone oxidoreductase subunit 5 (subunit L)/multisubunit Na+/H+ antiporter MnhA subunit